MPQDVTDSIEIEEAAPLIVNATHTGGANFMVELSDISGRNDEKLINTIGDFDGQVITPVKPGSYVFEVKYSEEYSLEMDGFGDIRTAPFSLSCTDPQVVAIEINSPLKTDLTTTEKDHVSVSLRNHLGQKIDGLVNEIGPTETSFMIRQEGQGFLFFDIRGDWEAEITEL
jgi:hypothetical protein